jgi:hypothetical protein
MLAFTGVTTRELKVVGETVSVVLPVMVPEAQLCVMVDEPATRELTIPRLPAALLITAAPVLLDVQEHVVSLVRFCVVKSV